MAKLEHDIWKDKEGFTMLCLAGELGAEARTLLEPDSEIIHSFEASSHFDAMTKYYEFMDFGKYESEFEFDKTPYDLSGLMDREKIRVEIDRILWEDWDPIGVNGIAPRDEYQRYVPQILNMVLQDKPLDEIADSLYNIETETIGVFGDRAKCKVIAEKIKQRHANKA